MANAGIKLYSSSGVFIQNIQGVEGQHFAIISTGLENQYTYSGTGAFAGFAEKANSRVSKYTIGSDIVLPENELELYVVDNAADRFLNYEGLVDAFGKIKNYTDTSIANLLTLSNGKFVWQDSISHHVEPFDPYDISDLTNTTWYFNEILSSLYSADIEFTFTDSNHNYSNADEVACTAFHMEFDEEGESVFYVESSESQFRPYVFSSWVDEEYRTIRITGGVDATDSSFIAWLLDNATYVGSNDTVLDSMYNTIRTKADNVGIFISSSYDGPLTPEDMYGDTDPFSFITAATVLDTKPDELLLFNLSHEGDSDFSIPGSTGVNDQSGLMIDKNYIALQKYNISQTNGEGNMTGNDILLEESCIVFEHINYELFEGEASGSYVVSGMRLDDDGIAFIGNFIPDEDSTFDIGSSIKKINNIYSNTYYGALNNKLVLDRNSSTNAIITYFDNTNEVNLYEYYPKRAEVNDSLAEKVDILNEFTVDEDTAYTEIIKSNIFVPGMVLSSTLNGSLTDYFEDSIAYMEAEDPTLLDEPEIPSGWIEVISPTGKQIMFQADVEHQNNTYKRSDSIDLSGVGLGFISNLSNEATGSVYATNIAIDEEQIAAVRQFIEVDANTGNSSYTLAGIVLDKDNGISLSYSKNLLHSSGVRFSAEGAEFIGSLLYPSSDTSVDIGSSTKRFNNLYAAGNVTLGSSGKTIDVTGTTNISGNLVVSGSITQQGSSYETHAEKIYTTKDYIYLREGATTALATGAYTGFEFIKYDGTNNGRLVVDKNGIARVGDVGDEEPIATREENPTNNGFAKWNSTNNRFETILPENITFTSSQASSIRTNLGLSLTATSGSEVVTMGSASVNVVTRNTAQTISAIKTFSDQIHINKGAGIRFYTDANYKYLLYGDAATNSNLLYMQITDDANNALYYKFMDADGKLYSHNSMVVNASSIQDITGKKTFVGDQKIEFKQSTSADQLGFNFLDSNGAQYGSLQVRSRSLTPIGASSSITYDLVALVNYTTDATNHSTTQLGFRSFTEDTSSSKAFHFLVPKDTKANMNAVYGSSFDTIYFVTAITDGSIKCFADKKGLLDISGFNYAKTQDVVDITGTQTISGNKTFTGTINVPDVTIS